MLIQLDRPSSNAGDSQPHQQPHPHHPHHNHKQKSYLVAYNFGTIVLFNAGPHKTEEVLGLVSRYCQSPDEDQSPLAAVLGASIRPAVGAGEDAAGPQGGRKEDLQVRIRNNLEDWVE